MKNTWTNLWVDDWREPPSDKWIWAKTFEEAMFHLAKNDVTRLALDYSLSLYRETGYTIIKMLEDAVLRGKLKKPETITCHSGSPRGKAAIEEVIDRLQKGSKP